MIINQLKDTQKEGKKLPQFLYWYNNLSKKIKQHGEKERFILRDTYWGDRPLTKTILIHVVLLTCM